MKCVSWIFIIAAVPVGAWNCISIQSKNLHEVWSSSKQLTLIISLLYSLSNDGYDIIACYYGNEYFITGSSLEYSKLLHG